jgi:hypothetical protein
MLMRSTLGAVIRHTASLAKQDNNFTDIKPSTSQHQDQKLHRQQAGLPGRRLGALNFIDFKSAKSEHTAVTSDLQICKSANLNMQQSLQFNLCTAVQDLRHQFDNSSTTVYNSGAAATHWSTCSFHHDIKYSCIKICTKNKHVSLA